MNLNNIYVDQTKPGMNFNVTSLAPPEICPLGGNWRSSEYVISTQNLSWSYLSRNVIAHNVFLSCYIYLKRKLGETRFHEKLVKMGFLFVCMCFFYCYYFVVESFLFHCLFVVLVLVLFCFSCFNGVGWGYYSVLQKVPTSKRGFSRPCTPATCLGAPLYGVVFDTLLGCSIWNCSKQTLITDVVIVRNIWKQQIHKRNTDKYTSAITGWEKNQVLSSPQLIKYFNSKLTRVCHVVINH